MNNISFKKITKNEVMCIVSSIYGGGIIHHLANRIKMLLLLALGFKNIGAEHTHIDKDNYICSYIFTKNNN